MKREATAQQKLFIDEYLRLRKSSQKQAALNAGYSPKSAESQASQLLKNPKVREYLKVRESQMEQELREAFFFDALEAREIMHQVMKSPGTPEAVRVSAAKDFLDRAGFKPVEKNETEVKGSLNVNNPYAGFTEAELESLIGNG